MDMQALIGEQGFMYGEGEDAVLLVHGLTGTPAEMKHYGKVIARKGFAVVCPVLAGHCATMQALNRTTWRDWVDGIEKVFVAMSQQYRRVFIAGLSMGALIALMIAARRPQVVAGVILLSVTFVYDGWNIPAFKQKYLLPLVLYTPLRYFVQWEETAPYGIKCERTRAMVAAVLENKDAKTSEKIGYFKTPATVIFQSVKLIQATRKCLPQVTTPLLIVHSTEDDMASLNNAYLVEKSVSSHQVETFYIGDTYHVLTLDKRKDDIAKRSAEFCLSIIKASMHKRSHDAEHI